MRKIVAVLLSFIWLGVAVSEHAEAESRTEIVNGETISKGNASVPNSLEAQRDYVMSVVKSSLPKGTTATGLAASDDEMIVRWSNSGGAEGIFIVAGDQVHTADCVVPLQDLKAGKFDFQKTAVSSGNVQQVAAKISARINSQTPSANSATGTTQQKIEERQAQKDANILHLQPSETNKKIAALTKELSLPDSFASKEEKAASDAILGEGRRAAHHLPFREVLEGQALRLRHHPPAAGHGVHGHRHALGQGTCLLL